MRSVFVGIVVTCSCGQHQPTFSSKEPTQADWRRSRVTAADDESAAAVNHAMKGGGRSGWNTIDQKARSHGVVAVAVAIDVVVVVARREQEQHRERPARHVPFVGVCVSYCVPATVLEAKYSDAFAAESSALDTSVCLLRIVPS